MAPRGRNNHTQALRMALAGLLTGLACVILGLGGLIPLATFAAPVFAGFCLIPLRVDFGPKTALLAYAATCIIALLLVADRELVLFFVFLTGYYPILQPRFFRIRSTVLRWLAKYAMFNAAVAAVYLVFIAVFMTPAARGELAGSTLWMALGLWAGGNLLFYLYDILTRRLLVLYKVRFSGRLFH